MEFKTVLKEKIDYIETLLNEYMPKEEGYQSKFNKMGVEEDFNVGEE